MSRYFLGWYFKCQSEQETIAVIPALHKANGEKSCSIQLITRRASWSLSFPDAPFPRRKLEITIGENRFSAAGIELHLHGEGLHAEGSLRFGPFSPLRYDIMGPFCCLPFMECRHSIRSMLHTVNGALQINDVPYLFQNAVGYLEGDRGRSFPRAYIWTQCCFPEGSLVLCVAEIPLAGFRFTGVIGVVLWRGREYRLATYLGARAVTIGGGAVTVQHDPKWTAEAIGNILDNAVKYTPSGGKVAVTVRPWQFYTRVDITDTGIGIPEEHYHDVFQRFYRAPEVAAQEGVGLGLVSLRRVEGLGLVLPADHLPDVTLPLRLGQDKGISPLIVVQPAAGPPAHLPDGKQKGGILLPGKRILALRRRGGGGSPDRGRRSLCLRSAGEGAGRQQHRGPPAEQRRAHRHTAPPERRRGEIF